MTYYGLVWTLIVASLLTTVSGVLYARNADGGVTHTYMSGLISGLAIGLSLAACALGFVWAVQQ